MKLSRQHNAGPLPISVTVSYEGKERIAGPFTRTFCLGRDDECEVSLPVQAISRKHAEATYEDGSWWLIDLESSNGIFCNGERIQRHQIEGTETFRFAADGPLVRFALTKGYRPKASTTKQTIPAAPLKDADRSLEEIRAHYLSDDSDRPAGEHTIMIRRAFKSVQKEEEKHHRGKVRVIIGIALVIVGFILVLLYRSDRARRAAEEQLASMFYEIKQMDLSIAELRAMNQELEGAPLSTNLLEIEDRLRSTNDAYEAFITEYGIRRRLSEEEAFIHRMALVFNESELEIPAGFAREVKNMTDDFWLTPAGKRRFVSGIQQAESQGYIAKIVDALRDYGLPLEFIYLALMESNFNPRAVSAIKPEKWNWAKGMWQFIPPTAVRYDLSLGPLAASNEYDPDDDRHDFEKSTRAAAKYINEIYTRLAQASGLLVIASYNWGEYGVARKLEALPDPAAFQGMEKNPKSRSYWRFYKEYAYLMPDETKEYVLKIFSIAVIGQNPRFFGIDMDDPLAKYRR
ncbi:MAG: hypothetical protein BMS9Abin05_2236 [Rhodothermia bacterium]|nr:MAG: hypothetical protein BMS9Abin05_2236 [Rhodothermia bacterium]